jgi:hypothetical protein
MEHNKIAAIQNVSAQRCGNSEMWFLKEIKVPQTSVRRPTLLYDCY